MAGQITYSDITEDNTVEYSQSGYTATREFIIDGVDMSDPASTTAGALDLDEIPARGDDHPSGLDMQADKITAKALSSNQIKITVTYKKLSAVEQEPDDSTPALMTIGSSVQQTETSQDKDGATLVVPYQTADGSAPKFTITSTNDGSTISTPTSVATAQVQVPNTVIRFSRREPNDPSDKIATYESHVNKSPCQWGQLNAAAGTLLCTRIEGNTQDGATSYIVEYEFQYQPDSWTFGAYYTLPTGSQGTDASGNVIGPGDIPTDAAAVELDIYDSAEFNNLHLFGSK